MLQDESKNHFSMQRVQTEKLQHNKEQEERSRQTRNEEVLPILQTAHNSQGNKIIFLWYVPRNLRDFVYFIKRGEALWQKQMLKSKTE